MLVKEWEMNFEEIYNEMNLYELENRLQNITPQLDISIFEMIKEVYEGNGHGMMYTLWEGTKRALLSEWTDIRNVFVTIVIIILISAVFATFKDTFENAQIAEISFYINYLILIVIFTNIFGIILEIGEDSLKNIEEFMRIFFPTFFLIVGSTAGIGTGIAYYQLAGGVIYLVEWCLLSILLPAVSVYMLFVLMNGIWEEERLALFLEIFQKGIKFLLKLLLGILTGASMIQSMILPIIDRVKEEAAYKAVEAIPGVGEVAEGALRIWLGSAALIKNSIGIVGCILLISICMIPIVKITIYGCFFKITAAILGIVGDKKMINCTNQVGDGVFMVLQTVGYGVLFFVVLIAITIYTTNGGF